MTDPLSITTSVVGITVPALHGVRLLLEDLQQLREAPKTITRLLEDVQSVETSLNLLRGLIMVGNQLLHPVHGIHHTSKLHEMVDHTLQSTET